MRGFLAALGFTAIQIHHPVLPMRFDPGRWMGDLGRGTNCYAYALDAPFAGWCRPGQLTAATGKQALPRRMYTVETLRELLKKDGLHRIRKRDIETCLRWRCHLMVAYIHPDKPDFHFYRYDSAHKTWSHKNGLALPENTDARGKTIYDPDACDRRGYNIRVGYFVVTEEEGVKIHAPSRDRL